MAVNQSTESFTHTFHIPHTPQPPTHTYRHTHTHPATSLAQTIAMSNAGPVSACDLEGVPSEDTLNAAIRQDARDSEFADFWAVPDFQLFNQVLFWSPYISCS